LTGKPFGHDSNLPVRFFLQSQRASGAFILALSALPLKPGDLRQPAYRDRSRLIRRSHHLLGHAIRFLFVGVIRLADLQLGLNETTGGAISGPGVKLVDGM